jgi:plasmid stability protein
MNVTTIRVEPAIRDRLAARAAAHGRSLGAELDAILRELDWQAIEAAYRRLAERPGELAAYLAEAESIAAVGLEELATTAAEEYPEYNP